MRFRIPFFSIVGALIVASNVWAQVAPSLGYVFPPAVEAGKTTEVALGGYDLTPDLQVFVYDDRVKLISQGPPGKFFVSPPPYWFGPRGFTTAKKISREIPARIDVSTECPRGLIRWQVANANGASATAVILVSDRREIVEDRFRDQPQVIESLPIGVSGRLSRITEVDRYQIQIEQDGPVTVELFARRLGVDFNGVLQVRDADGNIIVDDADTRGVDIAATFEARAAKPYVISIHDVDFRGHRSYVYRLALTSGPRVIATIPAAGRRGTTQKTEFIGIGVATGAAQIESVTREVAIPADSEQTLLRYKLQTPFGTAPAITIPLSDLPEHRDADQIKIPGAITSVIHDSNNSVIRFAATKGETLRIDALSQSIGTGLDLSLSILAAAGKKLAENDDLPGTHDAGLDFTVPADGNYRCVVRDISGRPRSAASVFRLSIDRQQPGFRLTVPQQLKVPIGGKTQLAVKAVRLAGFTDEILIRVDGLPDRVTVPPELKIPAKKNDLKIEFTVAADAACMAATISIVGEVKIADQVVRHVASASAAGNLCPRDPCSSLIGQVLLTTTMKPPFTVEVVDKNRQRAVHRGTTYPAPFVIKRNDGFSGEVQLMMAANQSRHRQGINGPIVTVPADAGTALYPCFMPEWLATDRTTRMIVLGMARVADPKGKLRFVTQAANARITMILEGALLKVSHSANELTVRPGSTFDVPITISRSVKLGTPVTVSLDVPTELKGAIECQPVVVKADQTSTKLRIRASADTRLLGRWPLTIKATTMQSGRWLVMSQTEVSVEFSASSSAVP